MPSDERTNGYETAFEALGDVYLEDSWVLDLSLAGMVVTFAMELVLTPGHPLHRPPLQGEQHCYRRGRLTLSSKRRPLLSRSDAPPATDASGTLDFGNIDSFTPMEWHGDAAWQMSGSWGNLLIVEPLVDIQFD